MFLGLATFDKNAIINSILSRVKAVLKKELVFEQFKQVTISFHFFPDEWDQSKPGNPIDLVLYPELAETVKHKTFRLAIKRLIDIVGSASALLVCLPLALDNRIVHQSDIPRPGSSSVRPGSDNTENALHPPEIPDHVCRHRSQRA
jgi:xanthine dehydrogenase iron-sulfur cluster and FAD-binding subunit A